MKIRLFSVLVLVLFCFNVSAELGGICKDNVLFWHDYKGVERWRDCSVIHTTSGVPYRGECRVYSGGAACYSVNGIASHEYIIESKKAADLIINPPTTTTTIPSPIINLECPKCPDCSTSCPECDCSDDVDDLNYFLNKCREDLSDMEADYLSRIPRAEFERTSQEYDKRVAAYKNETDAALRELSYEREWKEYYMGGCIFAGLIIFIIIYIWVKRPQLEDGFKVE